MTDLPTTGLGFPDLFVYTLRNQLNAQVPTATNPIGGIFLRPLRPDDPNASVAVFEQDVEPIEYEISGSQTPSLMRWACLVQVYVKAVNETDGRATRSKMLQRVRAALFSSTTQTALMTLRDSNTQERVSKFRMRRISFASGDGPRTGEMFFLGQVEIHFETEYH